MSIKSIKDDIARIRKALQKAVSENSVEMTLDTLIAIENITNTLTPELIKESKLGNVINSAREKFTDLSSHETKAMEIVNKAKSIMVTWKKIIETASTSQSTTSSTLESTTKETLTVPKPSKPLTLKIPASSTSPWLSNTIPEPTNAQRLKAIHSLSDVLLEAGNIDSSIGKEVAKHIEAAINKAIPLAQDSKGYMAKCRSLAFNIKRNKNLSAVIISKSLSIDTLVGMSANDLADEQLMENRLKVAEKGLDDKRSDWYEAHRLEILQTHGIDPSNAWAYDADDASDNEPEIVGD